MQQILDAITDAPAWVRNARHDLLAANRMARALYAPMLAATAERTGELIDGANPVS